jgi:hypothetical protein
MRVSERLNECLAVLTHRCCHFYWLSPQEQPAAAPQIKTSTVESVELVLPRSFSTSRTRVEKQMVCESVSA